MAASFINTLKRLEECPEEMLIVLSGMKDCECDRGQEFWNNLWFKIVDLKGVPNDLKKILMNELLSNAYDFRAHMTTCATKFEEEVEGFSVEEVSEDQAKMIAEFVSMNLLALFTLNTFNEVVHEIFFAEYLHRLVQGVECPVCREKMGQGLNRQPVQLNCTHQICDSCKESMIDHGLYKCPLCRETFHEPVNLFDCSLSAISNDDTEAFERFLLVDEPL